MPLYRVVCDGIDILDYSSKDLVLLAPDLELEVNTAGSFEFVMPPYHKYYGIVKLFESTIEVYEDNDCIWFGRAVEEKTDFYKQKKIYCEGPLSFFNDTIQRPAEFDAILLEQFFKDTIARHTQQVDNPNRRFNVGEFQMDSAVIYRKLDYESSYDVLTSMCLDTNGGYMFFRRENGINYIDWYKEMPYTCNQSIQFGLNLLNYSSSFDGSDFATCVLPLGEKIGDSDSYLNISEVNDGSDILKSAAVDTYGSIIKVQRWNDITDPSELKLEAQKWLEDTQFNASSIECSAADLHSKDGNYELFRVGQMVHCVSNPHLVDKEFPLSKMSLKLDSAVKIIALGIIKRKTLTRIYKKASEAISDYPDYPEYQDYPTDIYDPSVLTDEHGDEWELVWPEDGGPVTAERMPTHITIAREPNKTKYSPGEALDFTGLLVNIWTKNQSGNDSIWTKPPRYVDGHAPISELTFSTKTAPNIDEFGVDIMWQYKGKRYWTTTTLTTADQVDGISDLRNWTKHEMGSLVVGSNIITGQTRLGDYERLSYKITTGKNRNGVFSVSFSGSVVDGDSGSQVGHKTFIAACTNVYGGYIENAGNSIINKTQITGSGTYNVAFNSGNNDAVYLVIDLAAIKDGNSIDFHYTNISLSLQ